MARATSSLPVPLSPRISTVTSCAATRPIALYTSCMAGQRPSSTSPVAGAASLGHRGRHAHQPAGLHRPVDQVAQSGSSSGLSRYS